MSKCSYGVNDQASRLKRWAFYSVSPYQTQRVCSTNLNYSTAFELGLRVAERRQLGGQRTDRCRPPVTGKLTIPELGWRDGHDV